MSPLPPHRGSRRGQIGLRILLKGAQSKNEVDWIPMVNSAIFLLCSGNEPNRYFPWVRSCRQFCVCVCERGLLLYQQFHQMDRMTEKLQDDCVAWVCSLKWEPVSWILFWSNAVSLTPMKQCPPQGSVAASRMYFSRVNVVWEGGWYVSCTHLPRSSGPAFPPLPLVTFTDVPANLSDLLSPYLLLSFLCNLLVLFL